jgi:hypothetical protein
MSSRNLWGEPFGEELKAPVQILAEQAALLGQMTNNILEGRVENQSKGRTFTFDLNVVAPALGNYVHSILRIDYTLEFYPLRLQSQVAQAEYDCEGEEEFMKVLEEVLSSRKVRQVVTSLLSQSRVLHKKDASY